VPPDDFVAQWDGFLHDITLAPLTDLPTANENVKDLAEITENIKDHLDIKPVKWIDEVLQLALSRMPVPLAATEEKQTATPARSRRVAKRASKQVSEH